MQGFSGQVECVSEAPAVNLDPCISFQRSTLQTEGGSSEWSRRYSRYTGSSFRALLNSQDHVSSSHSERYRNVRRFLGPTRRPARILMSRGEAPVLTGGNVNSHTGCPC